MNRDEKATAVAEIGEELDGASAVFAVDYRGISVPQAAELRAKLREADASFSVVKNRLAKRATSDAGASDLDEHLVGPTALTFVRGDAVLAAKAISDFTKQNGVLAYKGGIMDGAALDPDQFSSIAKLPGVDVLRGQLVGVAASPLTGIVRTLNQLIAGMASQLGQIAEQGLVSGEAPAAEEAEAAAEPEAAAPGGEQDDPPAGEPAGDDEAAADAEPPAEPEAPEEAPEQTSEDAESSEDSETDNENEEENG
jgi:large subunit ribosomal protein L10